MVSLEKIGRRVSQNKYTKRYIALACLQGILIIGLQSAIASQNTYQASILDEASTIPTSFGGNDNVIGSDLTGAVNVMEAASNRLGRIKWENVAFISFQVWFVGMAFDATVYQNAAEVIALAVLNVICAVLGGLEVNDGKQWLGRLNNVKATTQDLDFSTTPLQIAFYIEIAMTAVLATFALLFAYASYTLVKELGWVIYKKIGPDVAIESKWMYRVFQFFVLGLKVDIFIEFLVSCFYIIQFAVDAGLDRWDSMFQLVVTILILPALYFGRMTVASENYGRILLFVAFQFVVVAQFILILKQTLTPNNYWYTWICFVLLGILFALGTAVLGVWCMHNFGKGLAPYIQRGERKREQQELQEQRSMSSWRIDDD